MDGWKVDTPAALSDANNYLAVNLYHILAEEKSNVFFSPFSISMAMAMLLCAAEGRSETELSAALGYDHAGIRKDNIPAMFQRQISTLLKSSDSYNLTSANSMLSQKGFHVKDHYKSILAESFKALLLEVDFRRETENVVSQINNWVSEKTNNMIPKLVDSLDPATVIILLNAVYFKGSWLHKFDKEMTFKKIFYNKGLENNGVNVDMMHMTEKFLYADKGNFQALQLPYAGEDVAMLILLPRSKDGLESLESSLTPSFMRDLTSSTRKVKVHVILPRFRLEYSKSLKQIFKRLGVNRVFRQGAELGIASDARNLCVSDIVHKAVLEVNEEGSEAAGATAVMIQALSFSFVPMFVADHPFAFVIYDTRSELILFMGRVEELGLK